MDKPLFIFTLLIYSLLPTFLASCGHTGQNSATDTQTAQTETFHADTDVAMVIRSVADAIRVGENLYADNYNYTGVLTDGTGRPLYSDLNGLPGIWRVEVADSTHVTVSNTSVGDLAASDLATYVSDALGSGTNPPERRLDVSGHTVDLYHYDWGDMAYEVRNDTTGGIVGNMVTITLINSKQ